MDENMLISRSNLDDMLAIHFAIEKLEKVNERYAKVVEMKYFSGMTIKEIAEALGVTERTIYGDWVLIKAWLRREFDSHNDS